MNLSATTRAYEIEQATKDSLKEAILADYQGGTDGLNELKRFCRKATKPELVNVATTRWNRNKAEAEALAAKQERERQATIALERQDEDKQRVLAELRDAVDARIAEAHEKIAELKAKLAETNDLSYELRWNADAAMQATELVRQLTPLANACRKQANEPTQTVAEFQTALEEAYEYNLNRLMDCDPTSMGLTGAEASLAAFKALQAETKILNRIVRYLPQELAGYEGRMRYAVRF